MCRRGAQVGRHRDPLLDAACLVAIRAAVGPGVTLRADANRAWGRSAAAAFGAAVAPAGLHFVEEPLADPAADLAAFHAATGLPVALDESVDAGEHPEALSSLRKPVFDSTWRFRRGLLHNFEGEDKPLLRQVVCACVLQ